MLIPVNLDKLEYGGEIFKEMCSNRWVLIAAIPVSHMNVDCNIVELPQLVSVSNVGWILKKGFRYRKIMMKLYVLNIILKLKVSK